MRTRKKVRRFTVVLERDEDRVYVASVPVLGGCHTQARTLDQAMRRIREAAELCLEAQGRWAGQIPPLDIVGIQQIDIPA